MGENKVEREIWETWKEGIIHSVVSEGQEKVNFRAHD